ncbi:MULTISPECIES: helix-turn-helix domain-containing protein [Actibacterium]|uniref:Transcriptional regulator with XRE-family HTH domain n=1 Tax=Actibacterium naphthalenivorans TaxID=1614693 RepID=A0A840CAE4_9RHOB|nr:MULTISPECIES: helix-turn-helix domain-containing protein [Actibacterium]ALG90423.1 hypothetical protein TQ29_09705 [Actibacterium sp. EMB200-NS6]MBB4022365.1 transcriptional regulator with XRE-family HTH domain [Actibacterium naphthalenivorans]
MRVIPGLDTPEDIREQVRQAAQARRIALRMTQDELAQRSGVAIATLKRFEQKGEGSFATVLAIAAALDALDEFRLLFPQVEAETLDDLERRMKQRGPVRVRRKADGT